MLKKFLETKYPDLANHIHGANYPSSTAAVYLVQLVQVLQFGTILFIFLADTIFLNVLGYPTVPGWVTLLRQNQLQVIISLFLLSSFSQNLLSTGAFEIELNGRLIYSKLATGRMPQFMEIIQELNEHGVKAAQGNFMDAGSAGLSIKV